MRAGTSITASGGRNGALTTWTSADRECGARDVSGVLRAEAADALLDPLLPGPFGVPLDHQRLDLGGGRLGAHRRVTPYPGLVAQQLKVVADVGEHLGTGGVDLAGPRHMRAGGDQAAHHLDPPQPRDVDVVRREPRED